MTKKDVSMKGISRIDSGSTAGWFVRVYRNGKTFSKLFSDSKLDGKENALKEAKIHRDELVTQVAQMTKRPRSRRVVFRDARNKTGEIGVSRTVRKGANGKVYESFSVSWRPEPGKQKCTSYSIRKYGEKRAFQMAVAHRRRVMKETFGDSFFTRVRRLQKINNPA